MEEMRADVFVRRLIERVGLRRQRLFAAEPGGRRAAAQSLSRLAELAAAWTRREPHGSIRDFVRHLSAVADAGELDARRCRRPSPGRSVVLAEPEQVKGLEFDHVYVLGLDRERSPPGTRTRDGSRPSLLAEPALAAGEDADAAPPGSPRLPGDDPRAPGAGALVAGADRRRSGRPVAVLRGGRATRSAAEEEIHEEELFGPAEGLHATYRMLRDEVLEASWRAGSALSEMRLDTARTSTGRRPLPRAAQARGAGPAPRRRADGGGDRGGQRAAAAGSRRPSSRPRSTPPRSTPTCSARSASAAARRELVAARASPRSSSSCRAAATAWRSRPPTSTST